jgi:hypothetical protein
MIALKARIGEVPCFIRAYYKMAWPLTFLLIALYFLEIYLISNTIHRIFTLAFLMLFVFLKRFDYLLLKKVKAVFYETHIEIEELDLNLPFSEINSVELIISGYKGEVSYRGAKPAKLNGYGNILRLEINEDWTLPMNMFLGDPNEEVTLVKYFSKSSNSTIKRLH